MNSFIRYVVPVCALTCHAAYAQPANVEQIVVIGVQDTHTVRTDDTMVAPADTAELLKKMPGANVNKNGELTGIAQYRGMFGDRINVSINGTHINSGGPNAMDAPLHYAPVALIESLSISRGIVPVSVGQETIGGHVEAHTYGGEFSNSNDFEFAGRAYVGGQTVNSGNVASSLLSMTNRNHIFRAFLMQEKGGDSKFDGGKITPSEYDRDRWDLGYSFNRGNHEFSLDFARNNTLNAGNAALPMDIMALDSDLWRSTYVWDGADYKVSAQVSKSSILHWMSNNTLRQPPLTAAGTPDGMRFRNARTTSKGEGFSVKVERFVENGVWRTGIDGNFAEHGAVILNPNVPAFFIDNFRGIERNIVGVYLERELSLSDRTGLEIGARYNRVKSDSGQVAVNMNPMNAASGMPFMMNNVAHMLAARFNAQDLSQSDGDVDWFARLSIEAGYDTTWYVGAARKMRAPSYQERYLWMPLTSTGGLADGKNYIGDPDLKPETAHEIELGFDYVGSRFSVYPRAYYKEVEDFIQGIPVTDMLTINFAQMMANMGMGAPDPLQFANVDATYYGMDLEALYAINSQLDLRMVASMVRGQRDDISDDLYRISPDNILLGLDYRKDDWTASLEAITYADQNRVSRTNLEAKTDGYTVFNVSGRWNVSNSLELGAGINNLLDERYDDHLAGYNRAYNPDVALGARLPGLGRSLYGRMMWNF